MLSVLRLGLRLAGGGGAQARVRGISIVLASAIGSWLLLNTFAVVAVETAQQISTPETQRLVAAVVAAIATPVVVLTATASRLSATIRDRRLASLRLLGLSPRQTRVVAATEVGVSAVVGTLVGALLFWATRPLVSGVHIAGRDWTTAPFEPAWWALVAVMIGVPLATVVVSLVPTRRLGRAILESERNDRRPSRWRVTPLAVGLLTVTFTIWSVGRDDPEVTQSAAFFAGTILTGLGILLIIPVFVRLIADVALGVTDRPTIRIAARRLQNQPGGMTRVVAGLLLGLFVVAGARCVVTAWEVQPTYMAADRALHDGPQLLGVFLPRVPPAEAEASLEQLPGVRDAVLQQHVRTRCRPGAPCLTAFVGTCADLNALDPSTSGCRDDMVAWIERFEQREVPSTLTWLPQSRDADPLRLTLPAPRATIRSDDTAAVQAEVFIPITTRGIGPLTRFGEPEYTVLADPGPAAQRQVEQAAWGMKGDAYSLTSPEEYYFVAALRALVWSIAAVILSIGLLAFAISAIDRAISRRAEVVSLQLLGVSPRTLRTTQWYESLLPMGIGLPLAVGMGWWAGSAFLALTGDLEVTPWRSATGLATVSMLAAVVVAALTVVAASPRIRADLIRRE